MGRKYDLIDVMAAVGLVTTLFGGYFVVTAASGDWQRSESTVTTGSTAVGIQAGIEYLQPALGQAIVEDQLLAGRTTRLLESSMSELKRAMEAQDRLEDGTFSPIGSLEIRASAMEADHAARVQWVMGRSIVNGTRRGIRTGILSADQYVSDFNQHLIRTAELTGERMHDAFDSTRQAELGRAIVDATQNGELLAAQNQERIGTALVHVAQAEEAIGEATATNQYQLATAAMAAVRSNRMAATMGSASAGEMTALSEPRTWPDIQGGSFVAAFAGLITVFCGGMALAGRKTEEETMSVQKVETLQQLYRMTG
jgi:hypothetical protein